MKQKINFNQGLATLWLVIIAALASALVVGSLVFAWQKIAANKEVDKLQKQINDLQNQIQQLQQAGNGQTTPTTPISIATQLLTDYFKSYLSTNKNTQERLLDYKINKIEIGSDEGTCFRFSAVFSVRPASSTGWMAAGNINSSGWIENASLSFDAEKQANGSYILGQGFTGAGSASCKQQNTTQCVAEGQRGGTESTSKLTSCCAGLNKVDLTTFWEGACENASGANVDQLFACIACGNGVCGTDENKCNCSQDCSNANITVEYPFGGAEIENPVTVSGKAQTFENNVIIRIKDANGNILAKTNTIAQGDASDGILDPFSRLISYSTPATKTGFVEVFDESAKDGAEIFLVKVNVVFADHNK